MALATARWTGTPYSVADAERLAQDLGVSLPLATVLVRRGLDSAEAARRYLAADERHDPFEFTGMAVACETILAHVQASSPIVVHGDYDVDGVCSTASLVRALRALWADPSWHIPARDDGYGVSTATVERLAAAGTRLILTADCAITSVEEVARAHELGIDVVVTDHHRPGERLPDCPIVHPGVCGYPFADLCAAGVAQKLSEALLRAAGADPAIGAEEADLVALATVADVVPLRGENRRLVRQGLRAIARTSRPGLRALMAVAQVDPGAVDERSLAFRLAPRINAAGRLARADLALELLLTEDPARAERIAVDAVDAFRHAFVRHAADALSPEDLVPIERVDAVVGPDRLGVPLAEELERLRPFGQGNPAPTFLVPAARVADVRSMGDDSQHSRFTIGGAAGRARAG